MKHIIDCNAAPYCPKGSEVAEHRKGGQFECDPTKVGLYLCEEQKTGWIQGHELRKLLAEQPVMNANVLDYWLANPHLIPEEWEGKVIFFWGTIYRDEDAHLYVRCLHWDGHEWYWFYYWLFNDWFDNDPAAVSLSAS